MRVLAILHAPPIPRDLGPARRHFHVLRALCADFDVSLVMLGTPIHRERLLNAFPQLREPILVVPPGRGVAAHSKRAWLSLTRRSGLRALLSTRLRGAIRQVAAAGKYDVVFSSFPWFGLCELPAARVRISDMHNVESDLVGRAKGLLLGWPTRVYLKAQRGPIRRDELAAAARFDHLIVTSTRDASLLRVALPHVPVDTVPNGVVAAEYNGEIAVPLRGEIVFTGLMSYFPNEDAARWFVRDIFPLVREHAPATLRIAGANPPRSVRALESPLVHITGTVPDIKPELARAEVVVVPLRAGGGTKVKILEAMAMRRPVVSTSIGCEGLQIRHGQHALIADSPRAFADAVVALLRNPELQAQMVANAHDLIMREYDWSSLSGRLSQVVSRLHECATAMRRAHGIHASYAARDSAYSEILSSAI